MILHQNEIDFINDNLEYGSEMIEKEDIDMILKKLSEIILYKGFDENYDLNEFGRKAQRIYDSIFLNN